MPLQTISRHGRLLASWMPNVLVIAILGGLGLFGHRYHWTIPPFSELSKAAQAAETHEQATVASSSTAPQSAAGLPSDSSPGETQDDGDASRSIRFRSATGVKMTGIEFATAELRPMDEFVVSHGIVGYDRTRLGKLSVRVPGTVWRVEKRVGQRVRKGDVLAIVDAAEVGRAKAAFLEALVRYKLAAQTLERLKGIPDAIAHSRLDEAKAALEVAHARRYNTMQALSNLGLSIDLDKYASLSAKQAARKLHFVGLPDRIARLLNAAECSANLIPLKAPFDGTVTECRVVVGEMVTPKEPQFVICDVSRMWLELNVRQEDARKLRLGQKVLFSVNGSPGQVPSTLTWIGTEIDVRTRTIQARAVVDNPVVRRGPRLMPVRTEKGGRRTGVVQRRKAEGGRQTTTSLSRLSALDSRLVQHSPLTTHHSPLTAGAFSVSGGMSGTRLLRANSYGTARIRSRNNPRAVVVPSLAVQWQWDSSQYVVFIPNPDGVSFRPRRVRPGMERGGYTEILEGLHPGEKVVTSGSRMLVAEWSKTIEEQHVSSTVGGSRAEGPGSRAGIRLPND